MRSSQVPDALQACLGPEAASELLELLDGSQDEAREDVISACTERFDRRLVEEVSTVRVQIAHVESSIRQDTAQLRANLREDIAAGRVKLFKWCFLFWVGQVLAVGGMLGMVLRVLR